MVNFYAKAETCRLFQPTVMLVMIFHSFILSKKILRDIQYKTEDKIINENLLIVLLKYYKETLS